MANSSAGGPGIRREELGGQSQKALVAPKQALQRKLLRGPQHLVRNDLKLNQPRASDGWPTNEGLWLVSKTGADSAKRLSAVAGN